MNAEQQAVVNKIFDSSTSVDDLFFQDSFRTPELLQEIINNKTQITSPLIAAKVGWFFWWFADYSDGTEMVLTNEVYDVIIHHCAKHATTAESVRWVALAISTVTGSNPDTQCLFSTPETVLALNNALQKYATSSNSVQYLSDCSEQHLHQQPRRPEALRDERVRFSAQKCGEIRDNIFIRK
jgi:hypothetical protein